MLVYASRHCISCFHAQSRRERRASRTAGANLRAACEQIVHSVVWVIPSKFVLILVMVSVCLDDWLGTPYSFISHLVSFRQSRCVGRVRGCSPKPTVVIHHHHKHCPCHEKHEEHCPCRGAHHMGAAFSYMTQPGYAAPPVQYAAPPVQYVAPATSYVAGGASYYPGAATSTYYTGAPATYVGGAQYVAGGGGTGQGMKVEVSLPHHHSHHKVASPPARVERLALFAELCCLRSFAETRRGASRRAARARSSTWRVRLSRSRSKILSFLSPLPRSLLALSSLLPPLS
eukprot:2049854-Rhodomonas_salina.1